MVFLPVMSHGVYIDCIMNETQGRVVISKNNGVKALKEENTLQNIKKYLFFTI
jgi:hypothetical protein